MKKRTVWRFFSSACLLAPACASAQSSVTLYGVITTDITVVNNTQTSATGDGGRPTGGSQVAQLESGTAGVSASRWGMRGVEDLGNGLKASFQLESGFSANNGVMGQSGTLFGRQAYISLSAPTYGGISVGRQGDPATDFVSPLLYNWYFGNSAIHPGDYDNLNFTHRINNSVKYSSDSFGGFRFAGLYSFGGVAGNFTQNQFWSLGASYSGGRFALATAIINARNPNASLYGTNVSVNNMTNYLGSAGSATSAGFNPSIVGFASAGTQQTVSVASTYTDSRAILGAVWSHTSYRNLGSNPALNPLGYTGTASFNTFGVSLRYQFTPFLRAGTGFDYTNGGNLDESGGAKYEQWNAGVGYSLSKATELFATIAYQHAVGKDSLGRPAVAQIGYVAPSTTSKQVVGTVGLKHLF